jgi:glutathione S-transferase
LQALEKAVSTGKWILGESFSAADVYVGSQIAWGMLVKAIEPRKSFQEYVARCAERPAFKRAAAQDEEYIKALA